MKNGVVRRSLVGNTISLSLARFLTIAVRIFYMVLVARFLGPELYGQLAYGQSWYNAFLPLTALGLGASFSTRIGENPGNAEAALSDVLMIRVVAVALTFLASLVLIWSIENDDGMQVLLQCLSLAIIFRSGINTWHSFFIAMENSRVLLRQELLYRPAEAVLGIIVIISGGGVIEIALVHVLVLFVQSIDGYVRTKRTHSIRLNGFSKPVLGIFLQYLPLGISTFLVGWMLQGPVLISKWFHSDYSSVAQLAILIQILGILMVIPSSLNMAAVPVLTRSVVEKGDENAILGKSMTVMIPIIGVVLFLCMELLGEKAVLFAFGDKYSEVSRQTSWVALIWIPYSLGVVLTPILVARKQFIYLLLASLVSASLLSLLAYYAGTSLGNEGVILALVVSSLLWSLLLIMKVQLIEEGFQVPWSILVASALILSVYGLLEASSGHLVVLLASSGAYVLFLWHKFKPNTLNGFETAKAKVHGGIDKPGKS